MVVIDSTMLLLLLRPDAGAPLGVDGRPISQARQRIAYLVKELGAAKTKILIPTPALSEVLVRAGAQASPKIVEAINKHAVFQIEPFDTRAAIEVAAMTRAALAGSKRRRTEATTWAKLKFDWQIVAIAKVNQATTIYSDDSDIRSAAKHADIGVVGLGDLELPPESMQTQLFEDILEEEE